MTHTFRLLAALAAACLWASVAQATTYYVRGDVGNDANDGTSPSSAFKTIQKGADAALPGDTVEVYAGTYRERVEPPRGGTGEDARITYMAKPGDHVIITTLDPWSPSWSAYGGSYPNLYYATPPDSMFTDTNYVDGGNPFKIAYMSPNNICAGQVVVDGAEYAEETSLSQVNNASHSWYANRTTGTIYINFGGSPAGHNVEITTRRGVFRPYLKGLGYITVQGFDMAYCGNNACAPGVMDALSPFYQSGMVGTRQGNHWKIIGNVIRNAKGVGLTFSMGTDIEDFYGWDCHGGLWDPPGSLALFVPHLEVVNPYIWDGDNEIDPQNPTVPSPSRPFKEMGFNIIADNVIANCGMNAIAGIVGLGNTIYGNCFSNDCRFISGSSAEDAIIKMHIQYWDLIEKNLFEDGPGNHRMLWLDNNDVGTAVSRNVFLDHANSTPAVFLEISSSPDQYLTVLDNNLFINCSHGIVSAVADGVGIYHNLFFRCGEGFAMGSNRSPMTGGDCGNMRIHAWNNLIVDQQHAFGFGFDQQVNFHSSDYNLMYRPNGVSYCTYLLTENGTGDGGDRAARPWCTTYYSQSDITAARPTPFSGYWSEGVNWGADNGPNGCEADLANWRGAMGTNIDLHSVERPYPGTSYGSATARTLTLNLGSDPSISGAPVIPAARIDFFGNVINSPVKAGCFQDLGSGSTTYTFWDDANLPPLPALPAAPSDLAVTTFSPTTMMVSWINNTPDAHFIYIERRINGGPWTFWGYITTMQNTMLDNDLDTESNVYEYRVAARNAAGLSSFAYVGSEAGAPSLKVFLTATNTAVVSWPWPSTGWELQENDDLGTTNWVISPETVNYDGTNNYILVTPPGKRFYRLVKPPPVADFTGAPTAGSAPLTVNFTDTSSNNPISWSWTFGDGGTSTARNPSHQYTSAGNYTVNLTVSNAYGEASGETKTNYIAVTPTQMPVANFTGTPTAGPRPLTVNFTDISSNHPTSWFWTFGDGGTSTIQDPGHQYTSVGNYTVSLTVSNAAGSDSSTRNSYITVTNGVNSLPEPWLDQDIGDVGTAGSSSYSGGTFTVSGAGSDMWGTADSFHFVYVPVTNDCTIVAHVAMQQNTASIAKAGVNIRETLTAGSTSAYMVLTPGDGDAFGWRTQTDGSTTDANPSSGHSGAPYWVKLVRSGNSFSAYESPDGSAWTQVGSTQTISMAANIYVGLCVCSFDYPTLGTDTFDNVTVSSP